MDISIEDLLRNDSDFSEAKFKSKVENEFIQIKTTIMTGKTEKIHHFVTEDIYQNIVNKVEQDRANNKIQMYDELNVSNIAIDSIEELENKYIIKASLIFKAYEYYINAQTRQYVFGNRDYRNETRNIVVFEKIKNAKELGAVRKCPGCGANIDVNKNGKCDYCGAIFNLQSYDWIITQMDI